MKALFSIIPSLCLIGILALPVRADAPKTKADDPTKSLPPALEKPAPESVEDLKAIQAQVKVVLKKVIPATVGVVVGGASGSGVIIDNEGRVLTAAHVSGPADRPATIIFPDGKQVKAKTLGGNKGIDSGMIQITDKGDWPHLEMGKSADLKKGQWVIATGHPGGFRAGRTPVVRLGRVIEANNRLIRTDCTLVGGDSGGPLFDMQGRVIGIHSRIEGRITGNVHVPVDTYRDTWDRLVKGEVWGGGLFGGGGAGGARPYLGVVIDNEAKNCRIAEVTEKSPAEKAGLKVGDVILKFDGKAVANFDELSTLIGKKKINDAVKVEVQRDKEMLTLDLKLGKREE